VLGGMVLDGGCGSGRGVWGVVRRLCSGARTSAMAGVTRPLGVCPRGLPNSRVRGHHGFLLLKIIPFNSRDLQVDLVSDMEEKLSSQLV
jgi:hypothetical protein